MVTFYLLLFLAPRKRCAFADDEAEVSGSEGEEEEEVNGNEDLEDLIDDEDVDDEDAAFYNAIDQDRQHEGNVFIHKIISC